MGAAGGSLADASYQFDFSVGEAATAEMTNGTNIVHIGFQQPYYDFFTGTRQSIAQDIQLYPNPFSGSFYCQASEEIKGYTLFDALGRQVFYAPVSGNRFQFSDRNLPKGFYSLRVELKGGKSSLYTVISQ